MLFLRELKLDFSDLYISVNFVRTLFLLHTLKMVECAPHNTSSRFLSKAANPIIDFRYAQISFFFLFFFGFIYAVHLQVRSIYSIRCTYTKKVYALLRYGLNRSFPLCSTTMIVEQYGGKCNGSRGCMYVQILECYINELWYVKEAIDNIRQL